MSVISVKIKCPTCLEEKTAEIKNVFDRNDKELVLGRDMFRFKCAKCGNIIKMLYDCEYIDEEKKFAIVYFSRYSLNKNLEKIKSIFDKISNGYIKRAVFSANELKEKIKIFDAGLDDRAIEICKIIYKNRLSETEKTHVIRNVYFGVNDGEFQIIIQFDDNRLKVIKLSRELYSQVLKMVDENLKGVADSNEIVINKEWALKVTDGLG